MWKRQDLEDAGKPFLDNSEEVKPVQVTRRERTCPSPRPINVFLLHNCCNKVIIIIFLLYSLIQIPEKGTKFFANTLLQKLVRNSAYYIYLFKVWNSWDKYLRRMCVEWKRLHLMRMRMRMRMSICLQWLCGVPNFYRPLLAAVHFIVIVCDKFKRLRLSPKTHLLLLFAWCFSVWVSHINL